MKILKYILLFAISAFVKLNATEIEPVANKFEVNVLKKAMATENISEKEKILFDALKDDRAGASLIFNAANIAFQNSNKLKSKELYLLSIKKMPNFYLAHRNLAYLYLEEQDFENAIKEFTVALGLSNVDFLQIYSSLGTSHFLLGNYSASLTCVENALALSLKDLKLLKLKAKCLNEIGDYSRLESVLNDILKIEKTDVEIWRMLVSLQLKKDEKMQALATLETMKSLSAFEEKDAILLGDIYANLNMFDAATTSYLNAKIPTEKAYKIARYFALSNHLNEAAKIASNLEKSSWQYLEVMGIISQAKGESGKDFFEKSHNKNPLNQYVSLRLADISLKEGNLENARTFYNASKSEFKKEAMIGLANVAIASGDFNLAINLLESLKIEFKTNDFDEFITKLKNAK